MTNRNPFPPLASQREIDRKPSLPTPGDWIGGIALFIALGVGVFIAGALQ